MAASEGKLVDIRPCIYCNEGCAGNISRMWRISCVVNPALGRERECRIEPAKQTKRVLVVGGGPAGMEAARIASIRGHDVTLCEKGRSLGGQLIPSSVPRFKKPVKDLLEHLRKQIERPGIIVKLGKEITKELVDEVKPDVVILATGATHVVPEIQGIENEKVATACEILLGEKEAGEKVAVIGGGDVGAELAWFLAEQGKKVTIIEMLYGVAMDVNLFSRFYLLDKLDELGVEVLTNVTAKEITDDGVVAIDAGGNQQNIKADTVVLAAGFRCNSGLEEELRGEDLEVYSIGDCSELGKIWGAIHGGSRIAREI